MTFGLNSSETDTQFDKQLAVAATISTAHHWECQQYAIDSQPTSTKVIQDLFRLFIAQRGLEKLEACWLCDFRT